MDPGVRALPPLRGRASTPTSLRRDRGCNGLSYPRIRPGGRLQVPQKHSEGFSPIDVSNARAGSSSHCVTSDRRLSPNPRTTSSSELATIQVSTPTESRSRVGARTLACRHPGTARTSSVGFVSLTVRELVPANPCLGNRRSRSTNDSWPFSSTARCQPSLFRSGSAYLHREILPACFHEFTSFGRISRSVNALLVVTARVATTSSPCALPIPHAHATRTLPI